MRILDGIKHYGALIKPSVCMCPGRTYGRHVSDEKNYYRILIILVPLLFLLIKFQPQLVVGVWGKCALSARMPGFELEI